MRIVSLLPSATEILCLLGLEDQLVGVTNECDFPPSVSRIAKVTRTLIPADAASGQIDQLVREQLRTRNALYALDLPVLERVRPDLIVTQTLCGVCAVEACEVEAAADSLANRPRVVQLEPRSLGGVLEAVARVGEAAGVADAARREIARLQSRIDAVARRSKAVVARPRVALLEWIDPPFSAGHWSPELVRLAGGREVLGREGRPSRVLSWDEVVAADPEVLVLACCGYRLPRTLGDVPILRRQTGWPTLACVRNRRVYAVDGSAYFNRPGPRLVDSLEILAHAIHPDTHPPAAGAEPAQRLSPAELSGKGNG